MSVKEVPKKEEDPSLKTAKSPLPPGTTSKSDVVNSAALDLKTAKSELLNLDLKTDQKTMNTAIDVDANNNKGSKENEKKDVDPFLQELYNTSDDEKIISGLRSKNSKRRLQREAERMEKKATASKSSSKKSSTMTTSTASSSGMKTAKRIAKPGTSRVRRGQVDLRGKPTGLTFRVLKEKNHIARCVLVLCNISDINLHFTLKSNGNAIIATYGNGHIAPHAQIRIILTWTRSASISDWKAEPQQKLLLATQFLDAKDTSKYEVTHTRLLGRVGHSKMCTLDSLPVEQLLLDAVGPKSQEHTSAEQPKGPQGNNMGMAMADFINNLTDRGLCALLVILAVLALVACSERR